MTSTTDTELARLLVDVCAALEDHGLEGSYELLHDAAKSLRQRGEDLLGRLEIRAAGPTAMAEAAVAALREQYSDPGVDGSMPAVEDCCAWIENGRRDRSFVVWIALSVADLETVDHSLWRKRVEHRLRAMGVRSYGALCSEPCVFFGIAENVACFRKQFCLEPVTP